MAVAYYQLDAAGVVKMAVRFGSPFEVNLGVKRLGIEARGRLAWLTFGGRWQGAAQEPY